MSFLKVEVLEGPRVLTINMGKVPFLFQIGTIAFALDEQRIKVTSLGFLTASLVWLLLA
jgi:hypothetical protein